MAVFPVPSRWNQAYEEANIPAGGIFTSHGTSRKATDLGIAVPLDPVGGVLANIGGRIEFSTKKDSAAALALPTGADRDELRNPGLMIAFIKRHGLSWIRFINGELGCDAANGSILLVTAFVTSKTYTSAVASSTAKHQDMGFELTLGPLNPGIGRKITWMHECGLQKHMRPKDGFINESDLTSKYYPFVRGFLISVVRNWKTLFRIKVSVQDGSKQDAPFRRKGEDTQPPTNGNEESKTSSPSGNGSTSVSQRGLAELQNISCQDYHPLALVNDILFDLFYQTLHDNPASYIDLLSSAEPQDLLIMSHDDNLAMLLKDGESVSDRETLKQRMMKHSKWQFDRETGVISLNLPNEKGSLPDDPAPQTQLAQLLNPSLSPSVQSKHSPSRNPGSTELAKYFAKLPIQEKENVDPKNTQIYGTQDKKRVASSSLDTAFLNIGPRSAATPEMTSSLQIACAF